MMPRPRPPHLHRETTRHGRAVWYVRVGKGPRIRLKADFGTDEFMLEYEAAIAGRPLRKATPDAGTLQWLYDRYRETNAWTKLSIATRRQRENIFRPVMERSGNRPFKEVNEKSLRLAMDARKPSQARHLLEAMKGLFKWAKGKHAKIDPTIGIETPKGPKTKGFPAWTEADVEAYERRWPLGTRQRVWLDVLLYTGGRRGDAHAFGRQHVRAGELVFRTEKSGEIVEVTIPILPILAATLEAGPCGDLAFICGARGGPLTKESFGNAFSEAARQAGIEKSAHGVRKIAATRAAENGATVAELEAIFGWSGGRMASLYTRTADRKRLSRGAMDKMQTSIPAPDDKVRASGQKPE